MSEPRTVHYHIPVVRGVEFRTFLVRYKPFVSILDYDVFVTQNVFDETLFRLLTTQASSQERCSFPTAKSAEASSLRAM